MEPLTIAVAIGGFIIPFLNTLFQKALTRILEKWPESDAAVGDLKGIGMTLLKIQATVSRIEAREVHHQGLMLWLKELKDAAYEADDLLDEVATVLRGTLQVSNSATTISLGSTLSNRMKLIRERLNSVANVLGDFKLGEQDQDDKLNHPSMIPKSQLTSSFINESRIIGRDEDKERIVQLLVSYNECADRTNAFVLPVVGTGGIGKTAIVQMVYNDERIKHYFNRRIWVCVSNVFDARRITKEIIEAAHPGKPCKESNWNMLQMNLQKRLQFKRFLLVLDDVWTEDQLQWEKLLAPFVDKREGSKIVVTTRSTSVAKLQGMMSPYILGGLSDDDSWTLFAKRGLMGVASQSIKKLEARNKEIVGKLNGSPLAAKTLARLLNDRRQENNWKRILRTEIWQLQQNEGDIMPILKRTYNHLPSHLKPCFAFCSLFPKGHRYDKSDLVVMWMAQGFTHSAYGKGMEDTGNEYFDDLIFRGILNHERGKYVMPALMNDLARYISADECSRTESGGSWQSYGNIRHLSLACTDKDMQELINSGNLKGLRTLLLDLQDTPSDNTLAELIKNMPSLRVLDLRKNNITQLPNSIKKLKHLRYLNLSDNPIKELPDSVCELHNLQTLVLIGCKFLSELPGSIYKLSNLRNLKAHKSLTSKILKIGRLTCLQDLDEFKVRSNNTVEELKGMIELRGCLSIQNLENVKSGDEAKKAMLKTKSHLQTLVLEWSTGHTSIGSERYLGVLNNLEPHSDLGELKILRYGGEHSSEWMMSQKLLHLEVLHLCDCPRWELLPTLGELRSLRTLEVRGMGGVKKVDLNFYGKNAMEKFPSLRELHLSDMPKWEDWSVVSSNPSFPRLTKLVIENCPKLTKMPPHVINYQGVTVQSEEISLPEPSSSYFIKISTCPELTRIYEGFLRPQVLKTIVTLTITACSKLCEPLPRECFQDFTSLNTLVLEDCPKLRLGSENRIPSSLKDLKIISCPSLLNKQVCMALENRDSPLSFKISNNYWDSASFSSEVLPHLTAFHSLQIRCCDELSSSVAMEYEGRPQGLPSLDLSIRGNFLLSISTWFRSLKSLSRLIISGGSNVNFLLSEAMRNLSGLRKLTLTECKQLQSLGLASLSSLEILTIEKCPKLKSFAPAEELSGLQDLAIRDCTNLVSLPADLIRIRSLKSLYISRCTSLRALPEKGVPSTLESLTIKGCPQLRNRCHKGGADRPKISHVTNITLE